MEILWDEEEGLVSQVIDDIYEAARLCLSMEGLPEDNVEISLSCVSNDEIRALNRDYRNKDSVTDVLSFPQFEDLNNIPLNQVFSLGDVIISMEQVTLQAKEYGHSTKRELLYLFVHSVLHLLGYDHENPEDKKEMRRFEEEVMTKLGIKYRELMEIATKAAENAYAPFSNFKVGAALLTKEGEVFTGVNVENSSFGGTICAERTAFVKAISEGFLEFNAIAVVSLSGQALPCGICRQFMQEFCTGDFKIITQDNKGEMVVHEFSKLFPLGFVLEKLDDN